MHVLLEALPAVPVAAPAPETALEERDAALDAGPELLELLVDPGGLDHIGDLQTTFLGEGHVLDAGLVAGRPIQVLPGGETAVDGGLAGIAAVEPVLTFQHGLQPGGIGRIAPLQHAVGDQGGLAAGQEQLVPVDRIPARLPTGVADLGVALLGSPPVIGHRKIHNGAEVLKQQAQHPNAVVQQLVVGRFADVTLDGGGVDAHLSSLFQPAVGRPSGQDVGDLLPALPADA